MKSHFNIPIFIPHLGCGNDCVFCNQHSITGNAGWVDTQEVLSTITKHLKYKNGKEAEIAFFGGSFTGLSINRQREYLSVAQPFLKSGQVIGIRISTRPDYISEEILNLLLEYGVDTVELGAQSMCEDVLKASKRGHLAEDTVRASHMIKDKGLRLGLQMMIGLPGDTEEKALYTAKEIVNLSPDMARIYPTVVLFDTELYNMYKRGDYKPLSVREAVGQSAKALKVFEEADIPVIRIGLQETESLGRGIAAGAYHPALGEMVRAQAKRNVLEQYILENNPKKLAVAIEKTAVSQLVGYKRENINYITSKYKIPVKVIVTDRGFYINGEKQS
jgi:histone acetyltransferase (RNA polymerase elongator complex component)